MNEPDVIFPILASFWSNVIFARVYAPYILAQVGSNLLSDNAKIRNLVYAIITIVSGLSSVVTLLAVSFIILVIAKFFIENISYKKTIASVGYAQVPFMLKSIFLAFVALFAGKYNLSPGMTVYFPNINSNIAKVVLANIDIFNLWAFILLVFAFSNLFSISKKKSLVITVFFFIVNVSIQVFGPSQTIIKGN